MTFGNLETEANNSISSADEISASSTYYGSLSSNTDKIIINSFALVLGWREC